MKTLYFEGAGYVALGDVENCRIRTAFHNNEGRAIYLELSGIERNKYTSEHIPYYNNRTIGFVDFNYYITESLDDCNQSGVFDVPEGIRVERKHYEYSKNGILNFVNKTLYCDFDEIKVCDSFDGYRVHKENPISYKGIDKYNFMEDFNYNETLSNMAKDNFNRIDNEIKERFHSQRSLISYLRHNDRSITIRIYASDEAMRSANLGSRREYVIKFSESVPIISFKKEK